MKRIICLVLAGAVITACGNSSTPSASSTPTVTDSSSQTATESPAPSDSFSPPNVETHDWITVTDKTVAGNKYWASFSYPLFAAVASGNAVVDSLVADLNAEMSELVTDFKSRIKEEYGSTDLSMWEPVGKSIQSVQDLGTDSVLIIRFEEYEVHPTAAHGISSQWTYVYDLATGERVSLDQQVLESKQSVFVDLVWNALLLQVGEEALFDQPSVRDSLMDWNNYLAWSIANEGMTITFNEYSVAPYASGTPAVSLTWKEINDVINPQSLIGTSFKSQLGF